MHLKCNNCTSNFRVLGTNQQLQDDLLDQSVTCPVCLEQSVIITMFGDENAPEMTATQFWTASNGFGFPDEIVTEPLTVESMLLSTKVIEAELEKTDTNRVLVRNLKLSNGVTLHFAASSGGAVIFKITKEKKDASRRTEESEI